MWLLGHLTGLPTKGTLRLPPTVSAISLVVVELTDNKETKNPSLLSLVVVVPANTLSLDFG